MARRGKCAKQFSDNGKNFVGASNEIKKLLEIVRNPDEKLANYLAAEGIEWKFIPARSPNFGGLWEAAIKSCIYHLKRVVNGINLTFEELLSVTVQIERILNSRPLCPLSNNVDDFQALTPAHFLINRSLNSLEEPNLTKSKEKAFLACLRRFVARRSKPSVIWSDNATNFKGARNILNDWNEICKSNTIQLFNAEEGIKWNFFPTASPHFGGLWEANIHETHFIEGSEISYHELRRVNYVGYPNRSSSEFSSFVSTFFGPNDFNPLTVGHFLTGSTISSFPESYNASDSLSYHSSWKLIQFLRNKFWNRWSTEYLTHLQTRAKWSVQNPNLRENQLVLLKYPNTKPLDWPKGCILQVFPGNDGLVRVVNVKTSTGILK
ncbi:integrase catalytic domain-containing protein [Trichonephila clavipes]|nr:integrase catalytic domain-containing protein [Trichonephila clavipes]